MAGTLRDELASLKIDRHGRDTPRVRARGGRGGRGIGVLALLLWMIPLGPLGFAGVYGYRQYEQVRSKTEVSVGVVQTMTSGEAEKLLSAKGYLKSRYQAMIGTRIPGRVEKMFVEENTRVKKGQLLAVLEHRDLAALLASRKAEVEKTEADITESQVDLTERTEENTSERQTL